MSSSWSALRAQLVGRIGRHDQHFRFATIRSRHPELARFPDIGALLAFQHRTGDNYADRDAVLRALVAEAQAGGAGSETATSILVLALWPGLDVVHGRLLRHYRGEPEMLAADLAGGVVTGIRRLDLGSVTWIAATLVRNLERDLRRHRVRDRRHGDHAEADDAIAAPTTADVTAKMLEADLRRIVGDDADLVVAIALFGERQHDTAARFGLSYEAARKRYQRALHRLREALAK